MLLIRYIDFKELRHRIQLLDYSPGEAHRPSEVGDDDGCAFKLRNPGHVEANRGVQRDPGNQNVLAIEDSHAGSLVTHAESAINRDQRSSDVAGTVTGKEFDRAGDVVDRTHPAERNPRCVLRGQFLS